MAPGEKTTIIIVSDLHLASGIDPVSGRRDPMEPFAHDAAFARWLDFMQERAATSGHSYRLLLLGDLFDFPRVRLSSAAGVPFQEGERAAITKLDSIAAGHPEVFAALGRWLGAGNPVDLVTGNHDIELMRPAVRHHLSGLLARAGGLAQHTPHLGVSPWIYHVPAVLYAEHGQQYHDLNSFPALVWLESQHPSVRNMTPGVAVDTFVQRVTARLGPQVDAPDSLARLLRNIARTGLPGMARVAPDVARLAAVVGRDLSTRWLPQHRARRELYRADVLPEQARRTGIPTDTLAQIDRLAESMADRLLARVVAMSWQRRRPPSGSHGSRPTAGYLERAANEILRLLNGAGVAPAFYVFGHSHRAEQRVLGDGSSEAAYLNSGTWAWQSADSPRLTFVTVTWDPVHGEATAALQKWNDSLRRPETVGQPIRIAVNLASVGRV